MKNIETALEVFLEASAKQVEAIEHGDYKTANKYYDKIIKSTNFLKSESAIDKLEDYLSNPSIGVRLWSACFLLPLCEKKGIEVLKIL